MALKQSSVATIPEVGTPYRLKSEQVTKAAKSLTKHLESSRQEQGSSKRNLLVADEDDQDERQNDGAPIFLVLAAKKHILDKTRLKPGKIKIPHTLYSATDSRICIMTADPPTSSPKAYKELIQGPAFPTELSSRIAKVIAFSRLKAKYKSPESVRQLYAEYDLFFADDRIINLLPSVLGKTFYKGTAKRPVPVVLSSKEKIEKRQVIGGAKKRKISEEGGTDSIGTIPQIARELENALSSTYVHLSQSVQTSVRVARVGFTAEQIAQNTEAAASELIERFIPQKWRNVKAIYIKGEHTASLPIWLAEELWVDENDVLEDWDDVKTQKIAAKQQKLKAVLGRTSDTASRERKRKQGDGGDARMAEKKARIEEGERRKKDSGARRDKVKQLKAQAVAEASA